jgi:hypothetical protein
MATAVSQSVRRGVGSQQSAAGCAVPAEACQRVSTNPTRYAAMATAVSQSVRRGVGSQQSAAGCAVPAEACQRVSTNPTLYTFRVPRTGRTFRVVCCSP